MQEDYFSVPNFVWGNGPKPCDIMVVGEAPGANEEEQGIPFVGAAGQNLNKALEEADIPRDTVFVTNVYKIRPPGNRTPTDEEIYAHFPYLVKEFKAVKPQFVLLLGNTALKAVTGEVGITQKHGTRLIGHKSMVMFNLPFVYCTYHPAAIIYNKSVRADFFNDIKTFGKIARGSYTAPGVNSP